MSNEGDGENVVKWLSVADLAKQADIPESTTRRYITRFDKFFRYEDRSRGRRYDPESVTILSLIQQLYNDRMEAEEIEKILLTQFPFTVSTDETATITPPDTGLVTKGDLEAILEEVRAVHQEVEIIKKENVYLHYVLDERLRERDKRLIEAMDTMLNTRKEIIHTTNAEQQKKKWYQFWKYNPQ